MQVLFGIRLDLLMMNWQAQMRRTRNHRQEDPEKPLMRHDSPKTTYLMGPAGVYTVTNSSYCRYYFLKTVQKNILLKFFLTVLRKNLRRISGP
jgi:hypothetical protein